MKFADTSLPGVVRITPRIYSDFRGSFCEVWNAGDMAKAGLSCDFVQDNQSISIKAGTLRGLHYQAPPSAQAKLVRVTKGCVLDVAVDIRRNSPTYGQWVAEEISAQDGCQLFIPRGFLHGFVTREDDTQVVYKVDALYDPAREGSVRYNDPKLAIDWGDLPDPPILSEKDATAPLFRDFVSPFVLGEEF